MDRERGAILLLAVCAMALLGLIATAVPLPEGPPDGSPAPDPDSSEPLNRSSPPSGSSSSRVFDLLLIGVALLILAGAVALVVQLRRGHPRAPAQALESGEDDPSGQASTNLDAVAEAAGEAATRIRRSGAGSADLENDVYRAWRDMTRELAVRNRNSLTPGEFADRAIQQGMRERDVTELTRLFEEIRYGGIEPTREYEQRAIALLERIEAEYGEDREDGS
jgi:hypothetical protein